MIRKAFVMSAIALSLVSASTFAGDLAVVNGKAIPSEASDELVKVMTARGEKDTPQLRESIKNSLIMREVLVQEADKLDLGDTDIVKKQVTVAKRDILIEALRSDYLKKNPVSDKEVKDFYNQYAAQRTGNEYHVKHILVKTESQAQSLLKQIKQGGNFEKLAAANSIDGSAARGGDLGWAVPNQFIKPFADAMVSLKKGQVSAAPVKTDFGYHIIKVIDSRKAVVPTYAQAQQSIKANLEAKKWSEYQMKLFKQAKVQ